MMQHILINISEQPDTHIDIMSHFKYKNSCQWSCLSYSDCRVNIDPTNNIGFSSKGKMVIIVNHKSLLPKENERKETGIIPTSVHLDFLSTDMTIDEYVELCNIGFIFNDLEIIVREGNSIVHIEIYNNEFHSSPMNRGLYLYAYNRDDVYRILPYYDGWLLSLLNLNRKYDENLKQIYLRVGYCRQFNLEKEIANSSAVMVLLLRDKKLKIHELNMKKCIVSTYWFDKNNAKCIYSKEFEELDPSPEVLNNWDAYGKIIKEYKLRFTFLPNPTSIKTRGLNNKNKVRNCYSAYSFYSKDMRPEVEEEYLLTNTEDNLNKDVINKEIGNRWKQELYHTKHMYEMYAVLDRIRYLKETKQELKYPFSDIEKEEDNYKKEEIVAKVAHIKLLFNNINQPLCKNAKYLIYYNINIEKYKKENSQDTIDDISKKIYDDFMKLSDYEFDRMVNNNNFNLKNITYDIVDDNAVKYLPSNMIFNTVIKSYESSSEGKELQTEEEMSYQHIKREHDNGEKGIQADEEIENQPIKRKHDDDDREENDNDNKCMKTSDSYKLFGIF